MTCLVQIGLSAMTTGVFPLNKSDGALLSEFHCKRILPNGEAVVHP